MRKAFLPSLLALWLVMSFGLWLFGVGFSNEWIPPLNLGTAISIYAPWLIFGVFAVRAMLNQK